MSCFGCFVRSSMLFPSHPRFNSPESLLGALRDAGIGQRVALKLNDVYHVLKYMVCADLSGVSLCP